MKAKALKKVGRKRRHKLVNNVNCPITKDYKFVHGYEVKRKKQK